MKIIVLPQAADEFDDVRAYYDQQQPGLGHRFRDEAIGTFVGLVSTPMFRGCARAGIAASISRFSHTTSLT